jgi:hypothetical protein
MPSPGMLDLAPTVSLKSAPDKRVVRPHEFERRAVAKARRHLGRTDDVGEHDGPQSGIHSRGRARGRARIANAAEERLDGGKIESDGELSSPRKVLSTIPPPMPV